MTPFGYRRHYHPCGFIPLDTTEPPVAVARAAPLRTHDRAFYTFTAFGSPTPFAAGPWFCQRLVLRRCIHYGPLPPVDAFSTAARGTRDGLLGSLPLVPPYPTLTPRSLCPAHLASASLGSLRATAAALRTVHVHLNFPRSSVSGTQVHAPLCCMPPLYLLYTHYTNPLF